MEWAGYTEDLKVWEWGKSSNFAKSWREQTAALSQDQRKLGYGMAGPAERKEEIDGKENKI